MDLYVVELDDGGRARCFFTMISPDDAPPGGLPGEAILGESLDRPELGDPRRFVQNPSFVALLQRVIEEHGPRCPALVAAAARQREGHLQITDARAQGAAGPDDVIGTFAVAGGKLGSYRAAPEHRAFTARGFVTLDPWLEARLREALLAL